jgi:pimeloyl-ACP methyl ester carboxylesterase
MRWKKSSAKRLSAAYPMRHPFGVPPVEKPLAEGHGRRDHRPCPPLFADARLLGRDCGFRLADVKVPVLWWHGDGDSLVPLAGVQVAVSRLQDAALIVRHQYGRKPRASTVLAYIGSAAQAVVSSRSTAGRSSMAIARTEWFLWSLSARTGCRP